MTLDGKIATRSGDSRISSQRDLQHLHRMRAQADAVMIGIGTLLKDDPLLTVRRVRGRTPVRVIIDNLGKTPPNSRIFSKAGRIIIAVSDRAPATRVTKLRCAGAEVIHCGIERVNLSMLLSKLRSEGIRILLLEGGGGLNWSMLSRGLVDEVMITVAPIIAGGEKATTLVEGEGARDMNRVIKLLLKNVERVGKEILLTYKVENS